MKNVLRGAMMAALIALGSWPQNALADQAGTPTQVAAPGSAAPGTGEHAAEADALFQHGVELMKADNCAEAVPEFLKSNTLDPSAATLLNLGTCYARLGRKATAWKTYQKAAAAADAERNAPLRERATQAMETLGPTLTRVQIVAPQGAERVSLRLNGEDLVNYDGLPIPLDPGQSVIEAIAPGKEPWRRTVNANEIGATLVIQVPDLPATQPLPPAVHPPPRAHEPDYRVPAAVIGGAGVVSVVMGTIFGLSAQSTYDSSNSFCSANGCTQQGLDQRETARDKATAATVMFSVGLAAVTAGVVLWLVSPSKARTSSAYAPLQTQIDARGVMIEGSRW